MAKAITHVLTREDFESMRICRAAFALELRVKESAGESLLYGGAELDPAIQLLAESVRALMSRCPTASAIVCRDCLEATLLRALVQMNLGKRRFVLRVPAGSSPKTKLPGLDFLLREARSAGLLQASLHKSARRIKEDGDFSAHLAARWDAQALALTSPSRMSRNGTPIWRPVRLWVTQARALSNLRAMERIIGVILRLSAEEAARPLAVRLARVAGKEVVSKSEWRTARNEAT